VEGVVGEYCVVVVCWCRVGVVGWYDVVVYVVQRYVEYGEWCQEGCGVQ